MKSMSPYDCKEKANIEAWRLLPPVMQHTIRTVQNRIQEEIDKNNPGRFVPTSGFRAESVNRKYGGAPESLHRLGMARDFIPVDGFFVNTDAPLLAVSRFRVLRSPSDLSKPQKCWHVEVIV